MFLNTIHVFCHSYQAPLDILGLSSLYKAENEELTYKELIDVAEDVVFELTSEQISEIEKHTRA